jgi:hypothetical protein
LQSILALPPAFPTVAKGFGSAFDVTPQDLIGVVATEWVVADGAIRAGPDQLAIIAGPAMRERPAIEPAAPNSERNPLQHLIYKR